MARFFGKIGFVITEPDEDDDNYKPITVEKNYYGDVLHNSSRWENSQYGTNDDLKVTKTISIVADSFIYDNIGAMKYVEYCGVKWKIVSFEPDRPRITLDIGGEWNGE